MGIRGYLAALSAVLLIPWVVTAGFGLDHIRRTELARALDGVGETARSLSLAIDRELAAAELMLRILARSGHLSGRDFSAFHAQATAATTGSDSSILLFDDTGRLILTTRHPYGSLAAPPASAPSVVETLRRGRVEISGLAHAPDSNDLVVMVSVPVVVEPRRYVIVHAMTPDHFQRVFADRDLRNDWIVSVFDSHFLAIARSPRADDWIGKPASERLRRATATAAEGTLVRHPSLEGPDRYGAYTRSPRSLWLVAVDVPAAGLNVAAQKAVILTAIVVVITTALAGGFVLVLGRRLDASVASIAAAAGALGRGGPLPDYVRSVKEIDALRSAVEEAEHALRAESDARERAETDRLQRFESEQAARQAAERQNRAKDEFLAMLGHELRNPLSAISGAVALMNLSRAPDDQWAHAREVIGRQTQHLSRVVDDLLDLSRVMTGKVSLEFAPVDLARAAASCLETLRASGHIGEQQVVSSLEPAWVRADPVRLDQIIANLLSSAVKHTPRDGRIALQVRADAADAMLCIRDTGPGIPPHLLPHLVDASDQGEQPLDRAKGGVGIGLALVQRLVHLHGGTVTAESAGDARSSAFIVRLPRLVAPITDATHPARALRPVSAMKALVVDDHEDSRTTLRMLLEQMGHQALEAADGIDGIQLALSSRPDVAIIDIGLPGIDGYEVARRLRALPTGTPAVMIALTGYGQDEDKQRALQAGFDIHLVKPVNPDRLAQALTEVTHIRARRTDVERRVTHPEGRSGSGSLTG